VQQKTAGGAIILQEKERTIVPRHMMAAIELEALEEMRAEKLAPKLEVLGVLLDQLADFPDGAVDLSVPAQ